ncbi:unnamed protein product [Prunus armeniaca]
MDVRDQLSATGVEISDDDTVILVLKGLPSEYNTVKAVIRGRDHGISLKDILSQLKAKEATIEKSTRNVPIMSAMAATTQDSSSGSGMNYVPSSPMPYGSHNSSSGFQDKGKGKMFYTQHNQSYSNPPQQFSNSPPKFGNGARGILGKPHQPFRNSYGSRGYAPVPICQIYHKKGHIAATCCFRSTIPSHSEAEPYQICSNTNHTAITCFYRDSVPSGSSHSTPMTAMAAQAYSSSPSIEVWIADIGATNHMTAEFGNLSAPTSYIGVETITAANGSGLAIAHIGSSSISTPTSSLQLTNVLHDKRTGQILFTGLSHNGLYPMPLPSSVHTAFLGQRIASKH